MFSLKFLLENAANFEFPAIAEHYALLITPVILVYNNRLTVFPRSYVFAFASFLLKGIYHSAVLAVVSLLSGKNLNYLLLPPPGPLEWFGQFYRAVMYAFCTFLTLVTRFGLVELVLRIIPRRHRPKSPQKKSR
jgi:hypothetical protein